MAIPEQHRHEGDTVAISQMYTENNDINPNNNNNDTNSPSPSAHSSRKSCRQQYSVSELVHTLGNHGNTSTNLPPELERRALDFRLAQRKRLVQYGEQKRWGIFGLYAHLANVRIDLEWAEDAAWRRQNGEPYLSWTDFDAARRLGKNRPWFTYAVIAVCTILLLVEFAVNGWAVEAMNVNPMVGPSRSTLVAVGARDTPLIVEDGQWFRLFTPLVLHAGVIHFAINMIAFWFIGAAFEQSHGIVNTIIVFMVPGVGGNILSAIFLPEFISVGASGGIFGLIGGCIADIILNWSLLFIKSDEEESDSKIWRTYIFTLAFLVGEILINLLLGLITPYIDNWSHLGGCIYGLCCAFSTIEAMPVGFFGVGSSTWDKVRKVTVKFLGLIVSGILIILTTVWLATQDVGSSPCEACRYISCVPFPFFAEKKWWYCDDCDFVTANLSRQLDGSTQEYYTFVELMCPNEVIETINVMDEMLTERSDVVRNMPSYCREHCDSVFN